MLSWFGMTPVQDTFQGAESLDANDYSQGAGMRQWLWQTCTEFGFFQVANRDPAKSVRSSMLTLDFHFEMCRQLFGLKNDLDTELKNSEYYRPLLDPKTPGANHIFFTNGAEDPWQYLSITRERGNDQNPLLNYRTIPGAAHCEDFGNATSGEVKAAKDEFVRLVSGWLAESSSSRQ
jgi:hypothetical protein